MNVFFYLILFLVATYPKVNEIELIRKYIGQKTTGKDISHKTAEREVEISRTSKIFNIIELLMQ